MSCTFGSFMMSQFIFVKFDNPKFDLHVQQGILETCASELNVSHNF